VCVVLSSSLGDFVLGPNFASELSPKKKTSGLGLYKTYGTTNLVNDLKRAI
jgi:hypothetical protein